MAKLPPKAFYKLRIAKQMRNAKYNLIAVEECIQNYLSIHFSDTHSTETSNSFNQLTNTINGIMDSLGIQFSYGAPINDSYTPIIMHRTAKSYFNFSLLTYNEILSNFIKVFRLFSAAETSLSIFSARDS